MNSLVLFLILVVPAASYKRKGDDNIRLRGEKKQAIWRKDMAEKIEEGRRLVEGDAANCVPDKLTVTGCDSASIIAAVKEIDSDCTALDNLADRLDEQCSQAKLFVDGRTTRNLANEFPLLAGQIRNEEELFIFYNGGHEWNEKTDQDDDESKLVNTAAKVKVVYDTTAQNTRIAYPRLAQFNQDNSNDAADPDLVYPNCALPSIMCCWSRDRQADDDNGNCATPYADNCVDADPADNTDVCYTEHNRFPRASRTAGGISFYGEGQEEGDAHCHGFVWEEDSFADQARFAGNNLFYVSMYDHMYTRGYVQNIPGAPMCGCLEHMPTVSRSDCTELAVTEVWELQFDCLDIVQARRKSLDLAYNACDGGGNGANDLETEIISLYGEDGELPAAFRKYLVGNTNNNDADSNCPATINDIEE